MPYCGVQEAKNMEVRILKLVMDDFKGIKHLEVDMNGGDVAVYGKNATGKTTVFDAFTWCLFGKDSLDRSDFWVKPHGLDGKEIHNLETAVEVTLSIDGVPQTYRHLLVENWVKKNGEHEQVYSGNTHKYWVNGVSKSAGDYQKTVSEIVSQDIFRLITNPMAFYSIKWDKRREVLLKLSPVDIDGIMLAKSEYQPLKELMELHRTDVYGVKKVKAEAKKRDNDEMSQIPVRISEQTATRDALGTVDVEAAKSEIAQIDAEIEKIEAAMNSGSEIIERIKAKADEVAQAEAALRGAISADNRAIMEARSKVETELATTKVRLNSSKITLADLDSRQGKAADELARLKEERQKKLDEWYETDGMKCPEYDGSTICPTCGQEFPAAMVEEAKAKFIQNFEDEKARKIAGIEAQGMKIKQQIEKIEKQKAEDEAKAEELRATVIKDEAAVSGLETEKSALSVDRGESDTVKQFRAALEAKKAEYDEAMSSQAPVDEALVQKKRELIARKNELAGAEAKRQQIEICNTRIEQLTMRQRELGIQIADTEQFLMLIDKFVTERCGMLEESINSLFKTVKWSLFEEQINGGIKDCCNCHIGGVELSNANNAAKINAGLEIIEVLSRYYKVTVPVFVDNAEAVNELAEIEAQRIALYVTDADETLRVVPGIEKKEVA